MTNWLYATKLRFRKPRILAGKYKILVKIVIFVYSNYNQISVLFPPDQKILQGTYLIRVRRKTRSVQGENYCTYKNFYYMPGSEPEPPRRSRFKPFHSSFDITH